MGGAPSSSALADALAIVVALRKIGAGIDGYRRVVATHLDLVIADLVAVGLLHQHEPQRASQIAEHTGLTPGSVTALLNRLQARGYITRVRSDQNRRSLQVRLTPQGRALGDSLVEVLLPALVGIVEDIGTDDCRTVVSTLDRVFDALAALAADPALPDSFGPAQRSGTCCRQPPPTQSDQE